MYVLNPTAGSIRGLLAAVAIAALCATSSSPAEAAGADPSGKAYLLQGKEKLKVKELDVPPEVDPGFLLAVAFPADSPGTFLMSEADPPDEIDPAAEEEESNDFGGTYKQKKKKRKLKFALDETRSVLLDEIADFIVEFVYGDESENEVDIEVLSESLTGQLNKKGTKIDVTIKLKVLAVSVDPPDSWTATYKLVLEGAEIPIE